MLILYSADRNLFYLSCRKRFRLTVSHITAAAEANINANGIIRLVVSPVCTALSDEVVTVSGVSDPDVSAGSEESAGLEGSAGSEGSSIGPA